MRRSGFTLLELVAVLLLIGVMLGMGMVQYAQFQAHSLARQGAALVASELERARSEAKRFNQSRSVRFSPGTSATSFQVLDAGGGVLRTVALPAGLVMQTVRVNELPASVPVSVTFLPPYGLVSNFVGRVVIPIRLQREQQSRHTVELVSLLGKVILR